MQEDYTDEGEARVVYDLEQIVQKDLKKGLNELAKAYERYEKAEEYFTGKAQEKFITEDLRRALTGSGNDFMVNLAGRVVMAVADRVEIAAVTARPKKMDNSTDSSGSNSSSGASGDNSSSGATGGNKEAKYDEKLTHILNTDVWDSNELSIESSEVHKTALIYGDAYLFVWPNVDDPDKVDVFCNSPMTTRIIYDEENPRRKKFAIKRWVVGDGDEAIIRVNMIYDDVIVKLFTEKKSHYTEKPADYRPVEDDETDENGVIENPFGEIPVFHFRTDRPYGTPEHEQAYGPQDALTKLVSSLMTTTDFAAYPQRWALSRQSTDTDTDIDWGDDDDESPEDKVSSLISGPGKVWILDNVDKVGEFQAAQANRFLEPMDKFIELMAAITGTPLSYLHKVRGTSSTPLSGKSQQATEGILLKKIENRERYFESSWKETLSFAMKVLGYENVEVSVKWDTLYTNNDKETWDAVLSQQQAGVPKRQTLLEQYGDVALVESWGFTEEEPNGPEPEFEDDPFAANARAGLRPEMKGMQFNKGQSGNPTGGSAKQTDGPASGTTPQS